MATRNKERISIYKIDTLEIIKIINYQSYLKTCMGALTENILLMTPNYISPCKRNYLSLVDLDNFEVVEFKTQDVRKEEEYYEKYPYANKRVPQIISIYDAKNLPDGTLTVSMVAKSHSFFSKSIQFMTHYKWNNNSQDIRDCSKYAI